MLGGFLMISDGVAIRAGSGHNACVSGTCLVSCGVFG